MSIVRVFARIRQNLKGENGEKFKLPYENSDSRNAQSGRPSTVVAPEKFDLTFEGNQKNNELYKECFGDLVTPFLSGHNVSTVLFGESNSGQNSTLFGGEIGNLLKSNRKSVGIMVLLANDLFSTSGNPENSSQERPFIKMSAVEIKGSVITDLMAQTDDEVESKGKLGEFPCYH